MFLGVSGGLLGGILELKIDLGGHVGHLGGHLGRILVVLGRLGRILGASLAILRDLRVILGGLGAIFGAMPSTGRDGRAGFRGPGEGLGEGFCWFVGCWMAVCCVLSVVCSNIGKPKKTPGKQVFR